MKVGVARTVSWLVEQGATAQEAVQEVLLRMKEKVGGDGGVIAVDKIGQIGIDWNSDMMAWSYARNGKLHYGIERGDDFVEDL